MNPDAKRLQVAAPQDAQARPLCGDGWKIQLAPAWQARPAERDGDFKLVRDA